MKIFYVIDSLNVGGAETIVTNYLIQFKQKGHEVALVELFSKKTFLRDKLIKNNIPIYTLFAQRQTFCQRVKRKIFLQHFCAKYFHRLLTNEAPDIVHFHGIIMPFAKIRMEFNKVFYSFHTDVNRYIDIYGKKYSKILRNWLKKGATAFALNEQMCICAKNILRSERVYTIYNGLDIKEISQNRYERNDFLKTLAIPNDAFVMGHVGRFHPVKNHEKVIDVFCEVLKREKNAYLLLIGDTSEKQYIKIKDIVESQQLRDRVYFLGLRQDATAIISVFDAFVLPSYQEGLPLVAIESQAHKVRTVVSSAIPEEVICSNMCFSLSVNEPSSIWADCILGKGQKESVDSLLKFDIDNVLAQLTNKYKEVLLERNDAR